MHYKKRDALTQYRCLETIPQSGGKPNLLVRVISPKNISTYFWMDSNGKPLKPAGQKIWKNCFASWVPKPIIKELPIHLLGHAKRIADDVQETLAKGSPVSEYFSQQVRKEEQIIVKKTVIQNMNDLGAIKKLMKKYERSR